MSREYAGSSRFVKVLMTLLVVVCITGMTVAAVLFSRSYLRLVNQKNEVQNNYDVLNKEYTELNAKYELLLRKNELISESKNNVSSLGISLEDEESSDEIDWTAVDIPEDCIGYISIPSCGVEAYIKYGTDSRSLSNKSVGEYEGCSPIGEGNYVLLGHARDGKDYVFTNLEDCISLGDPIYIQQSDKLYVFETAFMRVVNPDAVYIMDDTYTGLATLTIICCTDLGSRRFAVFGNLIAEREL